MIEQWMLHDMEDLTIVTAKKPGQFIALCDSRSFTDEENADHARLIAAAPDLLAALKVAKKAIELNLRLKTTTGFKTEDELNLVNAAIAKAHGPQATNPYLNKPRRSLEQAVRDSEGES